MLLPTKSRPFCLGSKPPSWSDVYYCQAIAVCWLWTPSLTRGRFRRLEILLALSSAVRVPAYNHILLFHIQDSPNLQGHVLVFTFPRTQSSLAIPQSSGFPYIIVASYDSQSYCKSILTSLHAENSLSPANVCYLQLHLLNYEYISLNQATSSYRYFKADGAVSSLKTLSLSGRHMRVFSRANL
jgi:hypothetical protein